MQRMSVRCISERWIAPRRSSRSRAMKKSTRNRLIVRKIVQEYHLPLKLILELTGLRLVDIAG
jgi:hypothetical protein